MGRLIRDLLDVSRGQQVFTLDPMRYGATSHELGAHEYDGSDGDTLRFGDGVFGAIPADFRSGDPRGVVMELSWGRGADAAIEAVGTRSWRSRAN